VLGQPSGRTLLRLVAEDGPLSRVELARRSGLPAGTVARTLAGLTEAGWIREAAASHRQGGGYELDRRAGYVLGVALGGSMLRAAVADLGGVLLGEADEPTDRRGGREVLDQVCRLARAVAEAEDVPWTKVRAVAVGTPGVLDPASGLLNLAGHIPTFDGRPVRDELERELRVPVLLDNDVNMAVLGEHWQGLGRRSRDFVFVAVGTGVGMGVVVDGRIRRGAHGAAGEICYLPFGADLDLPASRAHGAFEAAAAAPALLRRYAEARAAAPDGASAATPNGASGEASDGASDAPAGGAVRPAGNRAGGGAGAGHPGLAELFAAAAAGDPVAKAVVDGEGRLLARAVAAVGAVLDPELVVLGGAVGARPEILTPTRRWLARLLPDPVPVHTSVLRHRAALIGALFLALRSAQEALYGADVPDPPVPGPAATS
jgi:glucokinase